MGQLVLLEHLRFHQALERVDLAVRLLLHQLDLAEGALADGLDHGVVVRRLDRAQVPQVLHLLHPQLVVQLLPLRQRGGGPAALLLELEGSAGPRSAPVT